MGWHDCCVLSTILMPLHEPVHIPVPFPCVVYKRDRASVPYRFSHFCESHVLKKIPCSLRVSDLQRHDSLSNWNSLRKACFLVLVAGDVAQCISVSSASEKRTSFLYHGSCYSEHDARVQYDFATEFDECFVPLFVFGTLCSFDRFGKYRSTIPIEAAVCLFPTLLLEKDIPRVIKWIEQAMLKSVHCSVWVSDTGSSYNEHTLRESVQSSKKIK